MRKDAENNLNFTPDANNKRKTRLLGIEGDEKKANKFIAELE